MKHFGILKPDSLITLINWLTVPFVVVYLVSMFLVPVVAGEFSWMYIQGVWDRWQALNVGMLALASSVTAFNIARYNANRQRARNFRAAKAFLPDALSELSDYFVRSAKMLIRAWNLGRGQQLEEPVPKLPSGYREVFKECIKYAEPDVGEYLAKILVWLQVHDARLKNLANEQGDRSYVSPSRLNIITYLMRLGELQALVNKLFEFARSMGEFDETPLSWDDFHTAYRLLDIDPELFHVNETSNLEAHTKHHIDSRQT